MYDMMNEDVFLFRSHRIPYFIYICSRFVINVPPEELQSFERILFMIEQAHWYYLDVYRGQDPNLPSYNFKEFATLNILFL
jgi:hypothetical protein